MVEIKIAKLYFTHGTMRSGKSIDVIRAYDSYAKSGRKAIVAKPSIDTRDKNVVKTRKGYETPSIIIKTSNLEEIFEEIYKHDVESIIIDEAQFLTKKQVDVLVNIVDFFNIPVLCYGLKTNFRGDLFDGSKALLESADNIDEIRTVCQYCSRKATHNLRSINGEAAPLDSDEIVIGDEEYIQVCRKHFNLKNGTNFSKK